MPPRLLAGSLASGLAIACTPAHRAPETSEREPPASSAEPTPATIDPKLLDGRTFFSVSVEGRTLVSDTRLRLDFGDDGSFHASGGCNSLRSQVVGISTGVLDVYDAPRTAAHCGRARGEQDGWLVGFVMSKPAWSLEGRRLTLRSGQVTVVLIEELEDAP